MVAQQQQREASLLQSPSQSPSPSPSPSQLFPQTQTQSPSCPGQPQRQGQRQGQPQPPRARQSPRTLQRGTVHVHVHVLPVLRRRFRPRRLRPCPVSPSSSSLSSPSLRASALPRSPCRPGLTQAQAQAQTLAQGNNSRTRSQCQGNDEQENVDLSKALFLLQRIAQSQGHEHVHVHVHLRFEPSASAIAYSSATATTTATTTAGVSAAASSATATASAEVADQVEWLASALHQHLLQSAEILLDRLFYHLSRLPDDYDYDYDYDYNDTYNYNDPHVHENQNETENQNASASPNRSQNQHQTRNQNQNQNQSFSPPPTRLSLTRQSPAENPFTSAGFTLPASAVGWISSQLFADHSVQEQEQEQEQEPESETTATGTTQNRNDSFILSPSLKDRLTLLKFLLPRVKYLRICGGPQHRWPPPFQKTMPKQRKTKTKISTTTSTSTTTTSSTTITATAQQTKRQRKHLQFLYFYDALQHYPTVNLGCFPGCQVLLLDQVPADWLCNLPALAGSLTVLRMERSCISNMSKLLGTLSKVPFDTVTPATTTEAEQIDPLASPPTTATMTTTCGEGTRKGVAFYPKLTHVKFSECSLDEFSGLQGIQRRRGRPRRQPMQGIPQAQPTIQPIRANANDTTTTANDSLSTRRKDLDPLSPPPFPPPPPPPPPPLLEEVPVSVSPPPLSSFLACQSINLSHNQLSSHYSALAGLANMPDLTKVNLSYNQLTDMSQAHMMLGNIRELYLSYNRLSSAVGLDRLYSLEVLYLDHNEIADLASVSGLARLFQLKQLQLAGNPLELYSGSNARAPNPRTSNSNNSNRNNDSKQNFVTTRSFRTTTRYQQQQQYRIAVLDLFCQVRVSQLPTDFTFGQLAEALPLLDQSPVTLHELKILRTRTYLPTLAAIQTTRATTSSGASTPHGDGPEHGRENESIHNGNNDILDEDGILVDRPPTERSDPAPNECRPAKVQRRTATKRRRAQIDPPLRQVLPVNYIVETDTGMSLTLIENKSSFLPSALGSQNNEIVSKPAVTFTVSDVIRSLSSPERGAGGTHEEEYQDNDNADLDKCESMQTETTDQKVATAPPAVAAVGAKLGAFDDAVQATALSLDELRRQRLEKEKDQQPEKERNIWATVVSTASEEKEKIPKPFDQQGLENILVPQQKEPISGTITMDEAASPLQPGQQDLNQLSVSPIKRETPNVDLKASAVTVTTTETHLEPEAQSVMFTAPTTNPFDDAPIADNDGQQQEPGDDENFDRTSGHSDTPTNTSRVSSDQTSFLHVVSCFDTAWQDDTISLPSSTAAAAHPHSDEESTKFRLAETNSVYNGPSNYSRLNILENIELYFRLFVFANAIPDGAYSPMPGSVASTGEDDWKSIQYQYPRIQLWPIDRTLREAMNAVNDDQFSVKLDTREEFRRVWRESVVACGKPALRRLTPKRSARFGFHGELLWSAASSSHIRPDTVAEPREVIVCLSDTALYMIVDHDGVSSKLADSKKIFPVPIPIDACFKDAKWPHALVRHPFQTLRSITIGFGFQRLTLRFSNATFPNSDDYTYVLLTSNKLETVALLKELQGLANECKEAMTRMPTVSEENSATIDNDDRHVLDALGVAVAPDVIGAILHYQILKQRWKNGDRGSVRRVCVISDTKLFLLDEDYIGDGSESTDASGSRSLGETSYRLVDSAELRQVVKIQAADQDPNAITISIKPLSRLQRTHNWRLLCKDRHGAERFVEDVRKAISLV